MSLRTCYRRDGGWRVAFDYDADKVETLKATVPHTARTWDEGAKEWWIASEYEAALLRLFPSFQAFRDQPRLL